MVVSRLTPAGLVTVRGTSPANSACSWRANISVAKDGDDADLIDPDQFFDVLGNPCR